jgi:hypothetical protein
MSTTTSLMGLTVPLVNDPSPAYVDAIAASFEVLDAHNHASGGAPVPVAGLNINANLPFNDHSATLLRSVRFAVQASLLSASVDNNSLFVYGGDLYFLDGNNYLAQLTVAGQTLGAASGFRGDYASATANAYYNIVPPAAGVYYFQDHVSNAAPIQCGGLWIDDSPNIAPYAPGGLLRLCNITNAVMEGRSLPPGDQGFLYYDITNSRIRAFVGGSWRTVTVV